MKKIPKEMKVVIIGMLIQCVILYGIYKVNTVSTVSSTKDNAINYMNIDDKEKYEGFTEDEKKNIKYDYEVPINNEVCKIIDEDTLLVKDDDKIKEYNYKTEQYEKCWGELEKGYELQQAEKYGNRLFYSAIKCEIDDSNSNDTIYYFTIRCIDKDLDKEFIIFNSKEPNKRKMKIILYDKKLIILRYFHNNYEIGYINVEEEKFKYNRIYYDDHASNTYTINNIYADSNKLYWDKYKKEEATTYAYRYDFENENIEKLCCYSNTYYNNEILFYKGECSIIKPEKNESFNNIFFNSDFFAKDNRYLKFLESIKKYTDDNKSLYEKNTFNNNIYNNFYSILNYNLYGDKLLLEILEDDNYSNYFIYDYNIGEFFNVNVESKKNEDIIMEVLDIKDNIMVCSVYFRYKNNKLTIVKNLD